MPSTPEAPSALRDLVARAVAGNAEAWEELVRRFERMLRDIGRQYRLTPADTDDAIQHTWLLLLPRLETLRDPGALPGWLGTTMRRECLRSRRGTNRELLVGEEPIADALDATAPEDEALGDLLTRERRSAVHAALHNLPARHREMIELLLVEPALGYAEISRRLQISIGSIGPIRARCLNRLSADATLQALM